MRHSIFIMTAALTVLAVSTDVSRADGYQAIDKQRITECLETKSPRECFYAAVEPCMEVEIKRAANPSQAKAWCELREVAVWKEISGEAAEKLETGLPEPELTDFKRILENWEKDDACSFRGKYYRPMYWFFTEPTKCNLRKTHYEAETLLDYVMMLENGRFEFQRD